MKRKTKGGILATIGYLLSPFSWWNDLILNIPLAYAFAFPFGLISEKLFFPMMIVGYRITNIIGFIFLHCGAKFLVCKENKTYTTKALLKDIAISLIYTALVVIVIKIGRLKFPIEYFK